MDIAISVFVILVCIGMTIALLVGAYALWVDVRLTKRLNSRIMFEPVEIKDENDDQDDDYSDFVM